MDDVLKDVPFSEASFVAAHLTIRDKLLRGVGLLAGMSQVHGKGEGGVFRLT